MGLLDRLRRADAGDRDAPRTPYAGASAARSHHQAGVELMQQGRYKEALEEFRWAVRDGAPDPAESYYNMGVAYDYLSDTSKAVECYERATRAKPDYVEAYCGLGVAFSNLGKGVEAIKACLRAVRLAPEYPDAHNSLAVAYFNWGSYPEATKACRKALALDPCHARAHYTLGLIHVDLGEREPALRQYRALKDSDPSLADYLFGRIPPR